MSEESTPRRSRWLVVAVLAAAGVWVVRTRRRTADVPHDPWLPVPPPTPDPVPSSPEPDGPPAGADPVGPAPAARPGTAGEAHPRPSPRPRTDSAAAAEHGSGSAAPLPDGSAPGPGFPIKGDAGSMRFHPPTGPAYADTRAEVWFRTATDARAAGFVEWRPPRDPD